MQISTRRCYSENMKVFILLHVLFFDTVNFCLKSGPRQTIIRVSSSRISLSLLGPLLSAMDSSESNDELSVSFKFTFAYLIRSNLMGALARRMIRPQQIFADYDATAKILDNNNIGTFIFNHQSYRSQRRFHRRSISL